MRADHLSYKRAANVAMLGIAIQIVLGLALLLYGLLLNDQGGVTASILVLLGAVAWIALAIVLDQHRRERIEAVEFENFAERDLASSSVFEESGGEFRVAAKRLNGLYKLMLPAVSIAMGAALVILGWIRLSGAEQVFRDQLNEGVTVQDTIGHHGWAIAIGIGIAVIGFVFARFTSGMARAKPWEILRGGSVYSVGSAIFGLALAVAHLADVAGVSAVLVWLSDALSITMIVLGAEIFLNFVLDIYRPRSPGEYPRPAFDSRLLGFVAAPDRIAESISDAINYQFGYEVTSSWFYKLLSKSFLWLVLFGGMSVWLMTSLAVVEPHQRGILLVNGKPSGEELGPGLHVKPPWPFGRVVVPEFIRTETVGEGPDSRKREIIEQTATGVRVLQLGAEAPTEDKVMLWTSEVLGETLMVVQPSRESVAARGRDFGRGQALASVRVPVYYSVRPGGVESYLRLGIDGKTRDRVLHLVAQRELMRELASRSIDEIVGPNRNEIRDSLQRRIAAAFDALNPDASGTARGAGVEVLFVGFEDARPPREAAKAYEQVLEASQKSATVIIQAQQNRAETLAKVVGSVEGAEEIVRAIAEYDALPRSTPAEERVERELAIREMIEEAGGEAGDIILSARAARWEEHMEARSLAEEYRGKLEAYQAAPQIYETRMRFEAIAEAIKNLRLYIIDETLQKRIRLDLMDAYLGTGGFEPLNDGDM